MDYAMVIHPDIMSDGRPCYVAEHPDLPGCTGYGATKEQAELSLARATEAYLRALQEAGKAGPAMSATSVRIDWEQATECAWPTADLSTIKMVAA